MSDYNFILTSNQYHKLQQEYNKQLSPHLNISTLHNLISHLKNNSFSMPLYLQNSILNALENAQQILEILHKNTSFSTISLKNNPFDLIYNLSLISINLNSYTLKSAYQILYLKANNLILDAIKQISNYFSNKSLKIFKFI